MFGDGIAVWWARSDQALLAAASATRSPNTASSRSNSLTASSTSSATSDSSESSGLGNSAKIGIGVGVPLGVLCAIAIGCFLFLWRRRSREVIRPQDFKSGATPLGAYRQDMSGNELPEWVSREA